MRGTRWIAVPLLLFALVPAAHATNAVVPDAYPTIQQAIDSGVDTVWVKPGTYHELLAIGRSIALLGVVPFRQPSGHLLLELPIVDGIAQVTPPVSSLVLAGLHFGSMPSGQITCTRGRLTGCRFDAGLSIWTSTELSVIENCLVFGDLVRGGCQGDVGLNTVVGGTITAGGACGTVLVHDNVVIGPAAVGIETREDGAADHNYVRGCVVGILRHSSITGDISNNVIEDCSGTGILMSEPGPGPAIRGNVIRRCGAAGIDVTKIGSITGNVVEDAGLGGILVRVQVDGTGQVSANTVLRSGGAGITVQGLVHGAVTDNRVIGAQGDGISLAQVLRVSGNVVGHCTGRGIVATDFGALAMRNNTAYANGGAGFDVHSSWAGAADSLTNNIAAHNALGLAWSGPAAAPALLGCNDWFANTGGDVTGTPVGATDVALNPLFCDEVNDVVSLASTSPLVSLAGCGLVGAQGVGCSVAASAPGLQAPRLGRLRIAPQPSSGVTRFTWNPAAAPVELAIYDVTGARRWSRTIAAGAGETVWTGRGDDGTALPAGVYFARLAQGAERSEATVVVVR